MMVELQDFSKIIQGGRHKKSGKHFIYSGGYPAYGAGGLNGHLPDFEFDRPGIVLSSIGARCGKCFLPSNGRWSSLANTQVILPNPDKADIRFIWYQLNDESSWIRRGTGQPYIRPADIKTRKVYFPPLPDQRRIAAILDKADCIRRKREQALNMTDRLLQSAFREMFGDPVSNPKGWPVVKLGDCAEEVRYGTSVKCTDDSSDGLPVLRIPNVVGGEVIWDDLKFASLSKNEIGKLRMRSGDIIFVRTNGNPEYIARCAVFDSEKEALFASYLIRARLSEQSKLTARYVWMALSMPSYRRVLLRETKTTAGNYNISGSGLKSLKIPAPPLSEQQEFEKFYQRLSIGISNMAESLADAENLLGSLSQRAFRGEL